MPIHSNAWGANTIYTTYSAANNIAVLKSHWQSLADDVQSITTYMDPNSANYGKWTSLLLSSYGSTTTATNIPLGQLKNAVVTTGNLTCHYVAPAGSTNVSWYVAAASKITSSTTLRGANINSGGNEFVIPTQQWLADFDSMTSGTLIPYVVAANMLYVKAASGARFISTYSMGQEAVATGAANTVAPSNQSLYAIWVGDTQTSPSTLDIAWEWAVTKLTNS